MLLRGQPVMTQNLHIRTHLEPAPSDSYELRDEVRLTLLHETGHFFGLSDAELAELGLQ
jgi:predicted Zn-dependent protease with MMP-like domain